METVNSSITSKQKVIKYIDENQQDLVKFLAELVKRPSINPGDGITGDEILVQEFIEKSLLENWFDEVEQLNFDQINHRPNVIGKLKGTGRGRSLIFNGHSDVVPVFFPERWKFPPFTPTVESGCMYGRGTSDMKGGLAAAYFALKAIRACGIKLQGDVMLHSVVGEESQQSESIGTSKVIQAGFDADFAICCEPTDSEIHIASSALLFVRITIEGKGTHVSARNQMLFPQPGGILSGDAVAVDAFKKSLPIVDFMQRLEVDLNHRYKDNVLGFGGRKSHDQQGVGVFTVNPSLINGGEYLGSIPSRMTYTYAIWYPDNLVSRDKLIEEIRQGVQAISRTDYWLREHPPVIEAPVIQDWPGFHVDEGHEGIQLLGKALEYITNCPPIISGFKAVCDAYYLNKLGIPSIILGPGSISNSVHGDNEFIDIEDLITVAKTYAVFALDWCGVEDESSTLE